MSFMDYFRGYRKKSATTAKERLQIIVALERANRNAPDYLQALQRDIFNVLGKYFPVDPQRIRVNLERQEGCEVLELNVPISAATPSLTGDSPAATYTVRSPGV
ncbi:cell division topological specificity factor MinE [Magnetococcales bacterium HHB-1]